MKKSSLLLLAALFLARTESAYPLAVTAIRCYAVSLPFLAFNVG